MQIFRENTEDIYAGIEFNEGTPEVKKVIDFLQDEMDVKNIRFPESSSIAIKPVSKEGTERLVRSAINYAIEHSKPSVTLVHKGNIMKFTEGGFKKWGYELAQSEFGDKTFTWAEYDEIVERDGKGKLMQHRIKQLLTARSLSKTLLQISSCSRSLHVLKSSTLLQR